MPYKNPDVQRAYFKQRYQDNKQSMIADAKARKDKLVARLQSYVRLLKETTPCADCSRIYPFWVMDFDHRPGEVKKFGIAQVRKWTSEKVLLDEIAKCDIVCANCHRARTYSRQFNHSFVDVDEYDRMLYPDLGLLADG